MEPLGLSLASSYPKMVHGKLRIVGVAAASASLPMVSHVDRQAIGKPFGFAAATLRMTRE
jgi:hypothetical protein